MGRVGNRYVLQGGQTENQGGQTKKILPTLAWNPAGAPDVSTELAGVAMSLEHPE